MKQTLKQTRGKYDEVFSWEGFRISINFIPNNMMSQDDKDHIMYDLKEQIHRDLKTELIIKNRETRVNIDPYCNRFIYIEIPKLTKRGDTKLMFIEMTNRRGSCMGSFALHNWELII